MRRSECDKRLTKEKRACGRGGCGGGDGVESRSHNTRDFFFCFTSSRPEEIFHATVMPCYDKKLEASREDFYNDLYRTRDVDCVLSTRKSTLSSTLRKQNTIVTLVVLVLRSVLL